MSNNKELKIPDYKQTESLQESKNYLKLLKQDVVDKLPDNKKKRYLDKISAIEKNTKQVDFHRDIPLLYDELEREIEKEKTAEKEKTQKELKDLENQNDQKEITRWQNILKNNPEVVGILSDELADHDSVLRDKIFHMITDLEKNPPVLDFYNSLPEEERKPLQEYIGKASSKTSKIIEYLIANPEKMKIFRKAFKTPTVTPVNSPTVTPVNNPTVTPVNNPAAIKVDNPTATPVNKLNGSRNT